MASKPKWPLALSRPIETKGGPTLRTLNDARAFVLRQPETDQQWQHFAGALVQATASGKVADVSCQGRVGLSIFG
jgi:hypothetical protein